MSYIQPINEKIRKLMPFDFSLNNTRRVKKYGKCQMNFKLRRIKRRINSSEESLVGIKLLLQEHNEKFSC